MSSWRTRHIPLPWWKHIPLLRTILLLAVAFLILSLVLGSVSHQQWVSSTYASRFDCGFFGFEAGAWYWQLMSLFTIILVAIIVLTFGGGYIHRSLSVLRFTFILTSFVLSMLVFIVASSPIILILGWDGLGVRSYFLVCYFMSSSASLSRKITVFSNRIGDAFLVLMVRYIFISSFSKYPLVSSTLKDATLGLIVLRTAITKSAQFPFSSWLPIAIAAPTPVSSLVHSSTLVTAGIFLLLQIWAVLSVSVMEPLALLSSWVILISSFMAICTNDLKDLVALSTLSQLRLIFILITLGLPSLAITHTLTHALFKRSLFISIGSYIHQILDSQDPRRSRLSTSKRLLSCSCFLSLLGLSGMPLFSGYYSKETRFLFTESSSASSFRFRIIVFSSIITIVYRRVILKALRASLSLLLIRSTDLSLLGASTLRVLGSWTLGESLLHGSAASSELSTSITPIILVAIIVLTLVLITVWLSSKEQDVQGPKDFYGLTSISWIRGSKITVRSEGLLTANDIGSLRSYLGSGLWNSLGYASDWAMIKSLSILISLLRTSLLWLIAAFLFVRYRGLSARYRRSEY